jgi:hypothetical protein
MRNKNKLKAPKSSGSILSPADKLAYHERIKTLMTELQAKNQFDSFTQLSKAFGAIYSMSETNARLIVNEHGWRDEIMNTEAVIEESFIFRLTARPVFGFSQNIARSRCGLGC